MPIHVVVEVASIGAAAFLMVRSGLHSRLFDRPGSEVCPSCGRKRVRGVCEICSRRS